ncbi:MAG: hypothetical protein JWM68_4735 [Verrucomicrobiales bacterium]|nr:hypothetical protein [Verrucomicrobiales bacterium]
MQIKTFLSPKSLLFWIILPVVNLAIPLSAAEKFVANYDEAKMPQYVLPDALRLANGKPVSDSKTWQKQRRKELLALFEKEVYGKTPQEKLRTRTDIISVDKTALDGKATRKEVAVHFFGNGLEQTMNILLYVPNGLKKPAPAFLGLNFGGNQSIQSDPGITLSTNWMRNKPEQGYVDTRATEKSRGSSASRWQVEKVLSHGFAVATIYYGDIVPDDEKGGLQRGIHRLFTKKVPAEPGPEEWGAIGAWAWGLSRALDYLESDKDIDASHVAVHGHSRLGKASVWAGAQDERFAIVISNDSGCGGAALSKRIFGETVGRINDSFPHWFCGNFKKYNNKEELLPLDQHELLALVAPRPLYVASASEDLWADPHGEFLSAKAVDPVYALFGKRGLGVEKTPPLNQRVGETIGYHLRAGKHDITDFDWDQYIAFAKKHFNR